VSADEALQRSQHELAHVARVVSLGVLTASIGHDLNQFIVAILTNGSACLRWLSREPPNLEEGAAAVRRIMRDAALAADVIGSIRAFLQKTAGTKTPLNIADVVHEVRVLVDAEGEKNRVAIEQSVAEELPPVLAVRVELQQVLLNLMINAFEAMAEVSDRPRILRIRCTAHDAEHRPGVIITIEDSGPGFAADPERLFDAFYTTKQQGLGMGLAIARTIVEAHGGRLWATANPLHGATFHVTIPAAPQP
jgi:C4-dicarboxylate-specific signal transduction histidine kinase